MESATQPGTTEQITDEAPANGKPAAPEAFEVRRPVDGSVIETVPIDSPESVAEHAAARSAVRSRPGRRSASPAAGAGSSRCATGSSPTRTASTT